MMNQLRGGEESMETLGRALEEKTPGGTAARAWREVSSPPPPPTRQAEAARSASPAEAPRSATPARLRLETPLGKVLGGMGANLFRKLPEFLPMDEDVEEEPPRDHGDEEGPGGEEAPGEDAEAPGGQFELVESPRDDVDETKEDDTEEKKETYEEENGDEDEEKNGDEDEEKRGDGEERKVSEADTPEPDAPKPDAAAAAILAEGVAALIARIESNAATHASLTTRADAIIAHVAAIEAQNEELGRTIAAMTAAIDTLTGKN